MATSQYSYHPFHTIGAASVLLWDASAGGGAGAWQHLGKAADAAVLISTEQAAKELTIKGLTQPIARRNRSKRYSLSFRLLEDANPLTLDLLYSEGAAQAAAAAELCYSCESLRLYAADYTELAHPYGIRQAALPPVENVYATAGGSGGSIPPGTYYYWVVPQLGTGGLALLGPPAASGALSVGGGQQVSLDFDPPAGYSPDAYRIYASSVDDVSTATLAAEAAGPPVLLSAHLNAQIYQGQGLPLIELFSYDGQTRYLRGTDFSCDAAKGLIKRLAGGAIADGQRVLALYAYARPESVLTSLGDAVELERYRRVKLMQLAADNPDPALWRETGIEYEFYRVNVSGGDSRWPFSEDGFSEGAPVSWDCLYDGAEAKVGCVRSTYGVLAAYE